MMSHYCCVGLFAQRYAAIATTASTPTPADTYTISQVCSVMNWRAAAWRFGVRGTSSADESARRGGIDDAAEWSVVVDSAEVWAKMTTTLTRPRNRHELGWLADRLLLLQRRCGRAGGGGRLVDRR